MNLINLICKYGICRYRTIFDNGNTLWISSFYNPTVKFKTIISYDLRLKDFINTGYYKSEWKKVLKLILDKEAKSKIKKIEK